MTLNSRKIHRIDRLSRMHPVNYRVIWLFVPTIWFPEIWALDIKCKNLQKNADSKVVRRHTVVPRKDYGRRHITPCSHSLSSSAPPPSSSVFAFLITALQQQSRHRFGCTAAGRPHGHVNQSEDAERILHGGTEKTFSAVRRDGCNNANGAGYRYGFSDGATVITNLNVPIVSNSHIGWSTQGRQYEGNG